MFSPPTLHSKRYFNMWKELPSANTVGRTCGTNEALKTVCGGGELLREIFGTQWVSLLIELSVDSSASASPLPHRPPNSLSPTFFPASLFLPGLPLPGVGEADTSIKPFYWPMISIQRNFSRCYYTALQ